MVPEAGQAREEKELPTLCSALEIRENVDRALLESCRSGPRMLMMVAAGLWSSVKDRFVFP